MLIKVKSINHRQEEFEVTDLEQLVSEFAKLVCEKFNYENGVKLIYAGRILVHTEKLSKYFSEVFTGYIVCMEEKKKQEVSQPRQSINIVNNHVPPAQAQPTQVEPAQAQPTQTNLTSIQHNRALIYTFLRMFSTIRMFNYLYFTSPDEIIRLVRNGEFDDLIQQISSQTDQINQSIINNQHTMFDIIINDGLHENLLNSIMNPFGANGTSDSTTNTDSTPAAVTTNNISRGPPEIESESDDEVQQLPPQAQQVQQVLQQVLQQTEQQSQLTEEDKANIQTLISFGYGEQEATFAYIMSNKNLDAAANILMDM